MRNIFIGLLVAITTFFIGFLIQDLFQFLANSTAELNSGIVILKPVEDKPLFDLLIEEPTKKLESKEFIYPNPIYRFPQSGIYFSTRKTKDEQSEFQIELTYEMNYRTRKVRGVIQKYEILAIEGWAFDQQREYKHSSIKINKDKIILKTSKIKDIEYKFEGRFTKNEYFEQDFDDQIVLKGILQKFSNGKKVFEEEIEFTYEVGC